MDNFFTEVRALIHNRTEPGFIYCIGLHGGAESSGASPGPQALQVLDSNMRAPGVPAGPLRVRGTSGPFVWFPAERKVLQSY